MKEKDKLYLILFVVALISGFVFLLAETAALTSTGSGGINLTIWDTTDDILTPAISGSNVTFYSNFTNSSNYVLPANCTIRFNYTGSWTGWDNMTYIDGSNPYYFNNIEGAIAKMTKNANKIESHANNFFTPIFLMTQTRKQTSVTVLAVSHTRTCSRR